MSNATSGLVPVSVVVCARNRADVITRCLDSLIRADPAEVIVVDGNSSDKTVEIAREKGAIVVSDEGRGLGAARQLGAQLATYDHIVFIDTDTVICPETLRALLAEALDQNCDALQAELRTLSEKPSYWQEAEAWRRRAQMRKGLTSLLGCQATLIRKELLMKAGFDPAFSGSAEDADFCFRALAAGARLAHSAKAVAYHEDRRSLRQFLVQRIWYGQGIARMIVRYRSRYLSRAFERVKLAGDAAKPDLQYIPYILVSWSLVALGITIELLSLINNPSMRKTLRDIEKKTDLAPVTE